MDGNSKINSISLSEWYQEGHTKEEVREVFLYLDSAMKYVHDRGYCVKSFHPDKIDILNRSTNQIKFDTILLMPNRTREDKITQDKLKREDVLFSSILQIGLYSECLPYLNNSDIAKEHFDELASALPEIDAPYYRGIIERGAFVYFTDYEKERLKREREKMEQEMEREFGSKNKILSSNSNSEELGSMFSNEKINSKIYRQINREAAFLRFAIYPLLMTVGILGYILYKAIIGA